jgi:hypothetical protein
MNWAELIGGLGIGSLITSLTTNFLARRTSLNNRLYQEKREGYIGLLNALHNAGARPSDENSKAYALWQTRCNLFGSTAVSKYAQRMVDTNEGPRSDRDNAFEGLVQGMRVDLKKCLF